MKTNGITRQMILRNTGSARSGCSARGAAMVDGMSRLLFDPVARSRAGKIACLNVAPNALSFVHRLAQCSNAETVQQSGNGEKFRQAEKLCMPETGRIRQRT
ncbi:hypothetical protein [Burkholderia sp. BCC1047]|uniref:hypothetical protein n=1 Tax=Burkholderia sp. BCC1047 TaxID=2676299 RepID=UPI001ABBD62A|nr:hypothetical protein [Burkholderia sp. BCC1047]